NSDDINITVHDLPVVELGNDTAFCQGNSITLDAGLASSYDWSTGGNSQTIAVNASGNYAVTITDANGCQNSDDINITVNDLPIVELGNDTAFCQGNSITLDAGLASSYNWSTGDNSQNIPVNASGNYAVTITDTNGCQSSDDINITVNDLPIVELGNDTAFCQGNSVTLDVGLASSYDWSTGDNSQTISVNASGNYAVTITDANGCQNSDDINITVNDLPVVELGNDTAFCQGNSVTLDAGLAGSYDWSTGDNSQTIAVSASGNYAVTITDANGCQNSDDINITVYDLPVVELGNDTAFCQGNSVTLDAGVASSYDWSTGNNSQTISINASSNYAVTITDANGCQNSDDINITVYNLPIIELGNDTTFCQGNSITLDAGLASDYNWSTGDNSQTIAVSTSGNYAVTITDANGCQNSDDINITVNDLPIVELGNDTTFCQGNSVTLDAGLASSYEWSTGDNSQTIAVNASGNYAVTITDANGCQSSDDINITINDLPIVELGNDTAFCQGNSITLDAGVASSYDWSTGDNSQTISVNASGNYAVTITNANGCQGIDSILVEQLQKDTVYLMDNSCQVVDTGLFVTILSNQDGCDSVVIQQVDLLPSDTTEIFDSSCNPLDTGWQSVLLSNQFGCDSLVRIYTELLASDSVFVFNSSCHPSDTGTIHTVLTNQNGCDSLVITTTSLLEKDTTYLFDSSCSPIDTGMTTQLLSNADGCDSLVITTTTLLATDTIRLFDSSCNPLDTGTFTSIFTNQQGCDSTVIQNIELLLSDTTLLTANSCNPLDTGITTQLLANTNGCDSLVITTTTLLAADTTTLFNTSCNPLDTGTFTSILTNQQGCDSTVIQNINLLLSDTTILTASSCNPLDTGIATQLLANANGCDSLVITTTTLLAADTTTLFNTSCNPLDTGTFTSILTNQQGCDSIVIQNINLLLSDTTLLTTSSCNPLDTGTTTQLLTNTQG
ncbi:MAG: hypothetical protein AAFV95_28985, partial [Bacteroidota bacterium]